MHRIQSRRERPDIYSIMVEPRPAGATIGLYRGLPIAERVVDQFNRRFTFAGIVGRRRDGQYDIEALKPGQFVVEPGLIYDLEGGESGSRRDSRATPWPEPESDSKHQVMEDRRVLLQVAATFALFVALGLAVHLILRIFHLG